MKRFRGPKFDYATHEGWLAAMVFFKFLLTGRVAWGFVDVGAEGEDEQFGVLEELAVLLGAEEFGAKVRRARANMVGYALSYW